MLHAARWKYRTQIWCKKSPSAHNSTTSSGYTFATKAHIDNRKKNLLSSNISPTYSYNMVKFGPLAAEIVSLVWGTPANFNGFRVLAALLHSQTAALNRGRHLYSAGRPSRWALAHISSFRLNIRCFKHQIAASSHLRGINCDLFRHAHPSICSWLYDSRRCSHSGSHFLSNYLTLAYHTSVV